ncbi:hypothetical protein KAH43_06605 [Candidatus Bipolaricaulota bacterium]|nr:hypothetical protein [Candidatus Bipolaricaulota bacterium]
MKRILVLIAVLALLVAGTVAVLADPIVVGGHDFTAFSAGDVVPGNGHAYGHFKNWKSLDAGVESLLLSPIVVGGH